jgi:hypothetical protein
MTRIEKNVKNVEQDLQAKNLTAKDCEHCGITFTTQQDKEEHMKLEHKEGKGPAGVT